VSGLVGIACGEQARHSSFYADLAGLQRPAGTHVAWRTGPYISINRNELVKEALTMGADWLWFLDDDHRFHPDILERLLAHGEDITVPLCLKRSVPFAPVIYTGRDGDRWTNYSFDQIPASGTIGVGAAGTAGMLISRCVLEEIPEPWFEMQTGADGEILGEDFTFSQKAVEAGFDIVCDTDAKLGHIGTVTVWPTVTEAGQEVRVEFGEGVGVTFSPRMKETVSA
jgi:hypothetical protein